MTTATAPPKFSMDRLQQNAARANEGPLLIIGGAGTGKTHTLLGRISALIHSDASPFTITFLTFNSRSADSVRELLTTLPITPKAQKAIFVGTLHSYASMYLRQTGAATLGISPNYTLWDQFDSEQVVHDILTGLPEPLTKDDEEPFRRQDVKDLFKWHRYNQARLPEDAIPPKNATWLEVLDLYSQEKLRQSTLDLDDLVPMAIKAMEMNPEDRVFWARVRSRHLLVDEFQDITPIQYRMLQLMLGPTRSITIATDPNQNIYTWRGSNAQLLDQFKLDYPRYSHHILKLNHRSTLTLTNTATNLTDAEGMDGLFHSFQTAIRPQGNPPTVFEFKGDPNNMKRWILAELQRLRDNGTRWEDMACLYRSHRTFENLVNQLLESRIPYTELGETTTLKDSTAKKVINLLNTLINPLDTKSFSIAAEANSNDNKRRMTPKVMATLRKLAKDGDINLIEAAKLYNGAIRNDSNVSKSLRQIIAAWEDLNQLLNNPNSDLFTLCKRANSLVQDSTTYAFMVSPEPEFNKILALSRTTARLPAESPREHLSRFLELLATAPDPEHRSLDNDNPYAHRRGLTFSTIHAAKGLQWPVVCVLDATEGNSPGNKANDPEALMEEQRIFYVACTRATDNLMFFHHESGEPTRFLNAIGNDLRRELIVVESEDTAPKTNPR